MTHLSKKSEKIWSDTFFEGKIVSKDHLLSLPLWQNSLIRINNTPVLYIQIGFEGYHTSKTFNE